MLEIIGAVLVVLFALYLRWRWIQTSTFARLGIPGPKPSLFFGNIIELYRKGPQDCFQEWVKKYGRIIGYYYGMRPILLIADPEMVKTVLIKDFSKFIDRVPLNPIFKSGPSDPTGNHVISLKGQKWKAMRSVLTPAFSTAKMKQMSPFIHSAIDVLLPILEEKAAKNEEFNIHDMYQRMTMDVICRTAFGIEIDVQKQKESNLLRSAQILFGNQHADFFVFIGLCFPELRPIAFQLMKLTAAVKNKFSLPLELVLDGCEKVMNFRRANPKTKNSDILQLMLDAKIPCGDLNQLSDDALAAGGAEDSETHESSSKLKSVRPLNDNEIKGNSFVVFLAGYETTSTALAFTTYLLAIHPEIQERVREEVDDLMKRKGELEYGSVQCLQYLDQVFNESLRIYPPVTLFINRIADEDVRYGCLRIPKGMQIQIPVYFLHHDPEFWSDPEVFDPERFSTKPNTNGITFLPFGVGPRNCVGMRFAQMEAKMALANILHKFKIVPAKYSKMGSIPTSSKLVTLTPTFGVPVKVIRRENVS